jgi:hypothetical protein
MTPTLLPLDVASLWSTWGTPEFESGLAVQLRAHWQKIPLEKACENGGMPDNPRFHNFQFVESEPGALSITFDATFRETAVPGCGSFPEELVRFAEFTLEVTCDRCAIEYRDRDSEPEF